VSSSRGKTALLAERMATEIAEPSELRQPESIFNDQAPQTKARVLGQGTPLRTGNIRHA
jgi:hypothetical protein